MRCAVTGASGHSGANLLRALLAAEHSPRALVRQDTRAIDGLDVERASADLSDVDALTRAFEDMEVVFHLAAAISLDGDPDGHVSQSNVVGTQNVIEACRRSNVRRLVHFSSVHALDPGRSILVTEDNPLASEGSAYTRTKAEAESAVLGAATETLETVVISPSGIIGPEDHKPSPMGKTLAAIFRGRLPAVVDGGFDWVDVRDVADAAIRAAEVGKSGERYIVSGHYLDLPALGQMAAEVAEVRPPLFVFPIQLAMVAAGPTTRVCRLLKVDSPFTRESLEVLSLGHRYSHAKASEALGYRARPIEETLRDTFAWWRDSQKL